MSSKRGETRGLFRAVAALGLGSAIGKGIGVAAMPILARLYSPEQFGALALYSALVTVISPVLSGQYATAIPAPRSEHVAARLVSLSLMLVTLSAFVVMLGAGFAASIVGDSASLPALLILLVPVGAFGAALYEVGMMWSIRKKDFRSIAETQIVQSGAGETVKVVSALLFAQAPGLILGHLIGVSSGAFKLFRRNGIGFGAVSKYKFRQLKAVALLYSGFPRFRVPSTLLMVTAAQAPVFMITAMYGTQITGQFGLAMMLLVVPMNLIGQAVSKAFYGAIAEAGRKNFAEIYRLVMGTQRSLFAVGLPLTVVIMLWAEEIFGAVFGAGWRPAGRFASILAPFVLVQLTSAPLMQVFNLIRSQRVFLVINATRLALMGVLFWLAKSAKLDVYVFVAILSGVLFTFYSGTSAYVIAFTRRLSK